MFGLLSTTAISSMRPPMIAGPIERQRRFFKTVSSTFAGLLSWATTVAGIAMAINIAIIPNFNLLVCETLRWIVIMVPLFMFRSVNLGSAGNRGLDFFGSRQINTTAQLLNRLPPHR